MPASPASISLHPNDSSPETGDKIAQGLLVHHAKLINSLNEDGIDYADVSPSPWQINAGDPDIALKPKEDETSETPDSEPEPPALGSLTTFPGRNGTFGDFAEWLNAAWQNGPESPELGGSFQDYYDWARDELIHKGLTTASDQLGKLFTSEAFDLLSATSWPETITQAGNDPSTGGWLDSLKGGWDKLEQKVGEKLDEINAALKDPSKFLDLGIKYALPQLADKGLKKLFDKMWGVDDSTPMMERLAHDLAENLVRNMVDQLLSDVTNLQELVANFENFSTTLDQRIKEFYKGASSTASIPMGRVEDPDTNEGKVTVGALTVFIQRPPDEPIGDQMTMTKPAPDAGPPAARIGDLMTMTKPAPDTGPLISGNPTVLIEGMAASGVGHVAVGLTKGIVSLIKDGASTVLMGPAGMPVAIPTPTQAPPNTNSDASNNHTSSRPNPRASKETTPSSQTSKAEPPLPPTSSSPPTNSTDGIPETPGTIELPIREGGLLGGENAQISQGDPDRAAHEMRNQYQDGLCPDTRPYSGYKDPVSGITFGGPEPLDVFHWPEVCNRGTGGILDNIYKSYDSKTNEFIISRGYDPSTLQPGVQCCYDLQGNHGVTDSYDFSSPDWFSPVASLPAHWDLDMEPDSKYGDNYDQVPTSGQKPIIPFMPYPGYPLLYPPEGWIPPGMT